VEPRQQLARNIRQRRANLGISQEELGERAHLHRTEISLLERAVRDPRLSTIIRVAQALDLTAAELLTDL
jgi:transcriptional regulator with XRE-family HTH domain